MKIIAIKGKNGSGKSTVAAMLAKKLDEKGISNKVLSFAEPLKKIVNYMYDDVIDFENRIEKEDNRNLLETTADALKSAFSFNPFSKEIKYRLLRPIVDVGIVSDLRFDSEHFELADFVWGTNDQLIVVEITNPLTDNNPEEYDLDLIISNKTLNFDSTIEAQIDVLIEELL